MMINIDTISHINAYEGLRELCYQGLSYPNENYQKAFMQYTTMLNYAYHTGSRHILELGAGISTVLFAKLARNTGAEVYTIDTTFERVQTAIATSALQEDVNDHICFMQGMSVTYTQFKEFYSKQTHSEVGGVPISVLAPFLDFFVSRKSHHIWWQHIEELLNDNNWSAQGLFTNKDIMTFPSAILNGYAANRNFQFELETIQQNGNTGLINELNQQGKQWDLIFFDSGELSSLIEWTLLKNAIKINGLAVFHDIFFPKSFKNFIPCAAIAADPAWKIVHIDNTTKQGLLIAERLF